MPPMSTMSDARIPVTITMPFDEWQHVLGVLTAGARHLEAPAAAVVEVFTDVYKAAMIDSLTAMEVDAALAAMCRD